MTTNVLLSVDHVEMRPQKSCVSSITMTGSAELASRQGDSFTMSVRIEDKSALQGVYKGMASITPFLEESGLEVVLLDLVYMRVSQINGCALCLAMHARDLRLRGEREDRLYVLDAWRETTWFTERERAALAWAEAVTRLNNGGVPDEVFKQARTQFTERELADLTLATIAINGWNRLNIAFHASPTPFTIDAAGSVAAD